MNKKVQEVMFSSATSEWTTPQGLYNKLNSVYSFTLDPCCTKESAKASTYFTKEDNGLAQSWEGHTVFMNPPYGRGMAPWIEKAYEEGCKDRTKVLALIPSRTDTKWFHSYCMKAQDIKFLKGRLKFGDSKNGAPFPSMLVLFDGVSPSTCSGTPNISLHDSFCLFDRQTARV